MDKEREIFFENRRLFFKEKESQSRKKSNSLSNIRWLLFLAFAAILIFLIAKNLVLAACVVFLLFLLLYIPFVLKHKKAKRATLRFNLLSAVNKEVLLRLKGDLQLFPKGKIFLDTLHPYAKDLDIFGSHSLFQYTNHCATEGGIDLLASWLLKPAFAEEIRDRQKAVEELIPQFDYRQELEVTGRLFFITREQRKNLQAWLNTPLTSVFAKWFYPLVLLLNACTLVVFVACLAGIAWKWLALPILANLLFLKQTRAFTLVSLGQAEENAQMLQTFSNFLEAIENKDFLASKLLSLKKAVESKGVKASRQIARLGKLFTMLEAGKNAYFYMLMNFTFLWDLHWLRKLELFKKNLKAEPERWFNALSELEALSSLAALAGMHPHWVFPDISDSGFLYKAQEVAHPLIFSKARVSNDFSMSGTSVCWIVTGSNMSGKSTFLRTLAVNAVLALAGAPVCAKSLQISPMKLFTSMRTEDSLAESTSSFYAELKRLKQLLDFINEGLPVFYLLDEILKGTNSDDRHTGGKALVRQLQGKNGSGIIATHDLELAKLEQENPGKIKNYSFTSEIMNEKLFFDYKLKEGVCKSFNATELMRQIGIDIEKGKA